MTRTKNIVSILIIAAFYGNMLFAQSETEPTKGQKVEVLSLDELSFKKINGKPVRVLVGNVAFKKDGVIFKCDSAIQYIDEETIYAYKNVTFNQGDSLLLTGDELVYSDLTEMAIVKGKEVFMTDGKMRLKTTALYYNMASEIAYYVDSAYITDAQNVLSSQKGYYYARSKDMFFKTRVKLDNPDYHIKTDTLRYNVGSENSYFKGPSHINTAEGQYLYCENGIFYSKGNEVKLGKNSLLKDAGQVLSGDSLYFNSKTGMGYAYKRAHLTDTTRHLDIQGNYAEYNKNDDSYLITDSLQMLQYDNGDSLYLSSDTLRLFYDSTRTKRIALAYNNVRIYNKNYQAICDSMAYYQSDSVIDYYGNPVFWMDSFQISGVHIKAILNKKGIEKVYLTENALMAQKHPFEQYDQIAGDSMTAYFNNGDIKRVEVHSSAKAIYYALEADTALIGANEVSAQTATIRFGKNGLRSLAFKTKGQSLVTPAKSVNPASFVLNGFVWRGVLRPYSASKIFTRQKKMAMPVTQESEIDTTTE